MTKSLKTKRYINYFVVNHFVYNWPVFLSTYLNRKKYPVYLVNPVKIVFPIVSNCKYGRKFSSKLP